LIFETYNQISGSIVWMIKKILISKFLKTVRKTIRTSQLICSLCFTNLSIWFSLFCS